MGKSKPKVKTDEQKRQVANQQREQSRRQVARNIKLEPDVSNRLDALKSDTGLSLSELIGALIEIGGEKVREKCKAEKKS